MKEQEEQKAEFTVVDRRRFTSSGDSPPDVESPPKASPSPEQEPKSTVDAEVRSQPAADAGKGERSNKSSEHQARRVDFQSFVLSLATQASIMLGDMPHPETKLLSMNLGAARETIDLLRMLEDKTAGNLNEYEETLLREVITSLSLAFYDKVNN